MIDRRLRSYQSEAVTKTIEAYQTHKRALHVMATGLGKTVIACELINRLRDAGRCLFLAHRAELIYQAVRRVREWCGVEAGVELAEVRADDNWFKAPVVVGSIQTQISGSGERRRFRRFNPKEFAVMIYDEAHHAVSASYRRVLEHYAQNPNLKLLGMTATPDRADEKALGQIFQTVPVEYDLLDGIHDGWLVKPMVQAVHLEGVDFERCLGKRSKDFDPALLNQELAFEKPLQAVAKPTLELAGSRKTLVFTAGREQAHRLAEILNRAKPDSAASIDYKTPAQERMHVVERFRNNGLQYLVNVGIAGEGFDVPDIGCIVQARPTLSRALYAQQMGRGTRAVCNLRDEDGAEGRRFAIQCSPKPYLHVIDFVGGCGRHQLVTTMDALGGRYTEDEIHLAEKYAVGGEKPVDPESALEQARQELRDKKRKAEEQRRHWIDADVRYRTGGLNDPFDVLHMTEEIRRGWDAAEPVTERQLGALVRFGIPEPRAQKLTKREANRLMGALIARAHAKLASYKQMFYLKRYGIDATNMSYAAASAELSRRWGPRRESRH